MTINKTKKGVRIKFTALLIAGLLTLAAIICISAPKATKASAFSKEPALSSKSEIIDSYTYITYSDIIPSYTETVMMTTTVYNLTSLSVSCYYNLLNPYGSVDFPLSVLSKDSFRFSVTEFFPDLVNKMYYFDCSAVYTAVGESKTKTFKNTCTVTLANPVIPLPEDPIKEGHSFTGWFLDEACTIPYAGQTITED